ncbi:MAG TPA: Lrp/AsnC family transcriptional regulator [bacterium (Candidatus Stahlbacteria)]|nr:Lrp/AsnC family transcriptional regulator [Candidatus Stahlbacteria bacterium]
MIATAYVLIKVAAGKARQVYDKLSKLKGVQHVDAITGPYDIISIVQGTDFSTIGRMVVDQIQTIEGITDTITCNVISFEV